MDSDVSEILEQSEKMAECFKALEARRTLEAGQYNAVCAAANTFRWFRLVELSRLHAAFDADYKAELERMNRRAKTSSED